MIDWGFKAQRLGQRPAARPARSKQTGGAAGDGRQAADQGAGHPLHQQEDAGRPAEEDGARAARHRGRQRTCRSSAIRRRPRRIPKRCSISRAAARSGCSRRSAWRRRRCSGTSACRPCCRRATCAAAIRSAARASYDKAEKIITDNRVLFHRVANTLNYLDIKTVIVSLRHLLRPAAGLRVRQDLPGLPHPRHPRVPAGERREARRRDRRALHVPRPCHTPMKLQEPLKTVNALIEATQRSTKNDRCCGESGTLARHAARHLDAGALPQGRGNATRAPTSCAPTASTAKSRS